MRLTYLGLAVARSALHIVILYVIYGAYYGLSYGTAKAMVADLVPAESRGMAYGTYNAVLGLTDLPASFIAGILWSGVGRWKGFGPRRPFISARPWLSWRCCCSSSGNLLSRSVTISRLQVPLRRRRRARDMVLIYFPPRMCYLESLNAFAIY